MLKNGIFNVIGVIATAAVGAAVGFVSGVFTTSKAVATGSDLMEQLGDKFSVSVTEPEKEEDSSDTDEA